MSQGQSLRVSGTIRTGSFTGPFLESIAKVRRVGVSQFSRDRLVRQLLVLKQGHGELAANFVEQCGVAGADLVEATSKGSTAHTQCVGNHILIREVARAAFQNTI